MKKKSKLLKKEWRLNHLYKIVDKKGQTITFKMNKTQIYLYEYQKKYNRVIILKARQLGMSTYKIIEGLDKALFYKNQTIIITAHKQEKLKELFEKAKFAYDNLPDNILLNDGRIWEKPTAYYNNANELYFKEINSKIKVSLDSRSGTPTGLHITELAFMHQAREMWVGSMPSIPKNAPITVETTANGIGNFFQELWSKYYNKDNGEFKTLFFPWYDDKEYKSNKYCGELPNELKHLEKLGLKQEQINWYYEQYEILGREVFQEFPSTPEEAFLTTGNMFFNNQAVKLLETPDYVIDKKYKGLRIYAKPEDDCLYGVDTSGGGLNGDNSVIVIRNRNLDLLAVFYDKVPPDMLGEIIIYLYDTLGYKAYGTLGVEINNTGISTIDKLKNSKIAGALYGQKVIDERTQKQTRKIGFNTNLKTRPLILNQYEELIRNYELLEVDERGKKELFTFIYDDNGKPQALLGSHDDYVMADAICCYMINTKKGIVFK